jgi:3-deoxy-D-manno-octulosonic acid (KDO) 8-phosphate synthase
MTTFTKTFSNRELAGKYNPTMVDMRKEKVNRLISICGKYYTVLTPQNEMIEFIGKRSFDKWAKSNSYISDF